MKKSLLVVVLAGVLILGLGGYGNSAVADDQKELEEAQNDLQESYDKYGLVEEGTVDVLVAKFNTQIADNSFTIVVLHRTLPCVAYRTD